MTTIGSEHSVSREKVSTNIDPVDVMLLKTHNHTLYPNLFFSKLKKVK